MRILLIKPRWFCDGDGYKYKDLNRVPPLNLGIIAALSPNHEVQIVDEDVENIPYSPDWDLVGITAATFTSQRAYTISEKFRQLGAKTILGGIHSSLMPQEALRHFDSVVIGEAEPVWKKILLDFEKNNLQRIYNGNYLENLDEVPFPRRDLFPKNYFASPLQVTRGCPNHCRYCYLQSVPWGKWRKRNDLDKVYEEMKQIPNNFIFVIDDNLFVDLGYAKKFCDTVAPLKKKWGIQAPTTIAKDDELLEKLARAGCFDVSVGFQSINAQAVKESNIRQNKTEIYKKVIKKINSYGIVVEAFFMFGFDSDDKGIFKRTVEAIKQLDVDDAILYILTPYPGTAYFEEFNQQNRILTYDWSKYSWWNCVYQPKQMSPEELNEGLRWAYEQINKHFNIKTLPWRIWKFKKRAFENFPITVKLIKSYISHHVNITRLP